MFDAITYRVKNRQVYHVITMWIQKDVFRLEISAKRDGQENYFIQKYIIMHKHIIHGLEDKINWEST